MATNRGVAYIKPGVVEVQSIPYPKAENAQERDGPVRRKRSSARRHPGRS